MKKQATNLIAYEIIKRQATSGSLGVFELTSTRARGKKLLMMIEIEVSDKDNESIIEHLKSELEHQFFNAPTQTTEYAFEHALAKANIKIKDTLLAKPKNWLNKLHISAVAINGEEVHLASVGNAHAFLIHNQKIVDVLKSSGATPTPNPVKLFTNIVSGTLGTENELVLANESVLDYLSPERIRKCAHEDEIHTAMEKLTELLVKAPETKQFALAIVNRTTKKESSAKATAKPIVKKEIPKDTNKEEEETYTKEEVVEKYLAPEEVKQFESKSEIANIYTEKLKSFGKTALTFTLSLLSKLLELLQKLIKQIIPILISVIKAVGTMFKHQSARTYHTTKAKESIKGIFTTLTTRSRKQSIIGVVILILVIVFVSSIALRAREKTEEAVVVNYEGQHSTIEKKISEAEAALIYQNNAGAATLLTEAQTLLDTFVDEFPNQKNSYDELTASITSLRNRTEKKNVIDNLEPIITITPAPISNKETGLVATDDALLFYDGVQEKIAQIDTERELLLTIPLENQGIESFYTVHALTDNTVAGLSEDTVLIIDTEDETIEKQSFVYSPKTSKPFVSYSRNLYTFNTSNNQIIRYRRAGKGFTAAQNWLQQEYDLTNIVDIEIDGFIYLIDTGGNIHAFLNGKFNKRIPWPLNDEPGNTLKLFANEEGESFYILDPKRDRIIHMTKSGDLIVQFTSKKLRNATDLITDKDESNIYILAEDKIFKIPITAN
jgi:hypothetical protein